MARRKRGGTNADIEAIRQSLISIVDKLVGALASVSQSPTYEGPTPNDSRPARVKRPRMSAERRVALQLQGRYMALVRSLKPRQKAQVKATRDAKGLAAALSLAAKFAKR